MDNDRLLRYGMRFVDCYSKMLQFSVKPVRLFSVLYNSLNYSELGGAVFNK